MPHTTGPLDISLGSKATEFSQFFYFPLSDMKMSYQWVQSGCFFLLTRSHQDSHQCKGQCDMLLKEKWSYPFKLIYEIGLEVDRPPRKDSESILLALPD